MFNFLLRDFRCPVCKKLLGKCLGIAEIKCTRCKEVRTVNTLCINVNEENKGG